MDLVADSGVHPSRRGVSNGIAVLRLPRFHAHSDAGGCLHVGGSRVHAAAGPPLRTGLRRDESLRPLVRSSLRSPARGTRRALDASRTSKLRWSTIGSPFTMVW